MSPQEEAKKEKPRYLPCPDCGRQALLVDDKIRWSGWRCPGCRLYFKTCAWPRAASAKGNAPRRRGICGARLPEGALPLGCPECGSILNMDAAPRRATGLVVPNVLGLSEIETFVKETS